MNQTVLRLLTCVMVVLVLVFSACNEDEPIPGYVHIPSIDFEVSDPIIQGSSSHKIPYCWVFADNVALGAFPLPATIPVLSEGNTEITVFGGILENGILSTVDVYPFYERQVFELNIIPENVDTIFPKITYADDLKFRLVEDFEGSHVFSDDYDGNPDTKIELSNEDVFEGSRSGRVHLTQTGDNNYFEVGSIDLYGDIPVGQPVYMEMNYKTTIPFEVGVRGKGSVTGTGTYYKLVLTPTDEWKKIYVSFDIEIADYGAHSFQLVFFSLLAENEDEGEILLDNIKFLHF